MPDTANVPRHPYQVPRILDTRKKVFHVLKSVVGKTLSEPEYEVVVNKLIEGGAVSGIDSRVLWESMLLDLVEQPISKQIAFSVAWRIAGNSHTLRNRIPVLAWQRQARPEWVPVQFTDMRYHVTRAGKAGYVFEITVLGGTPAGLGISKFFSKAFCFVLARDLGFTSYKGGNPLADPRELGQLRAWALVTPDSCAASRSDLGLDFEKLECSGSLLLHNKTLIRVRNPENREGRSAEFVCPYGYKHSCFRCYVGTTAKNDEEHCPIATHPTTYRIGVCEKCENQDFLDPAWAFGPRCFRCQAQYLHSRNK